ncbi:MULTISPECIES: hypothetical protein [Sphingobacterium]|uniref:Uncharacterized protein n=1 Tax=Sphingobacterium kitahiroshimense TaxID=470446 RepID=A0ABV0BQJ2_9SPHI|nr:hypothetical protein [Sphingobacterium sp. B16(2022)]NJI74776.1 hypothetical protein [Sphingobacterium sp. B16(2022)]
MFDFEKPKNPYRKKGKDYNLSENSKLAGADFAYSNTLASRIYKQMKIIQDDSAKYESFLRLKKKLYMVIRNDRQHDLGQLKLGYGNINPLKNFRFSPKTSWQTFFMNYPTTNFDAEKEELCISTPPILARELDTLPERVRKVILKMHIIKVSIDDENTVDISSSKELVIVKGDDVESRSVIFSIKDKPNVLLLCVATVRMWLLSTDRKEEFLTLNTKYMTAEIFDAILIRNGQICKFEEETNKESRPSEFPDSDEELDWV